MVSLAASQKWINVRDDFLTRGIREAYEAGLGIAIPTGPDELGFVMDS